MLLIVGGIAELERSLVVERVRAGVGRAILEGRRIGRARLNIDREQVLRDSRSGKWWGNMEYRELGGEGW
jgi:DNA invertase Pin-like site-specific DNA recombinase